jgi:PST family polysaccharide transporter
METTADVVSYGVAIALAVAGAGYWALVVQRLLSPAVVLVAAWTVCRWRPARPAPTAGVAPLVGYGASVTGSQLSVALARSVDQIMIGWLWGPVVLGLYERTTRLLLVPINTINAPVYATAMPALSRLLEQPARYRSMFCQVLQKLGLLTMPVFALAAVIPDWVVQILFGPSWLQATPLVALFSISATSLPVLMALSLLYLSQARTTELLRATLIDSALTVVSILVGLQWGVVGVAASLALVGVLVRTPLAFWLAARRGPVGVGAVWRAVAPPISIAVAVALVVGSLRIVTPAPTLVALAAVAATALAVMVLGLFAWPETRREIREILAHRRLSFLHS